MKKEQKIIVVKVGTSTLTHNTGMLNLKKIERLCKVLCDIENSGKKLILVSSGAISAGWGKLGLTERPTTMSESQAAAAVGQCDLINMYEQNMLPWGYSAAQILLTKDAVLLPERRKNAENVLAELLRSRVVIPIINENDSVSCEGIEFGGNDVLAAYVATLAHADLIINLSDVKGLYDSDPGKNPEAKLISEVRGIDEALEKIAGGAGTARGTGGMKAKIESAKIAGAAGIDMIIASGSDPEILYDLCAGKPHGTYFYAEV